MKHFWLSIFSISQIHFQEFCNYISVTFFAVLYPWTKIWNFQLRFLLSDHDIKIYRRRQNFTKRNSINLEILKYCQILKNIGTKLVKPLAGRKIQKQLLRWILDNSYPDVFQSFLDITRERVRFQYFLQNTSLKSSTSKKFLVHVFLWNIFEGKFYWKCF